MTFDFTTAAFYHASAFLHVSFNILGLFCLAVAIISLLNVFAGKSPIDPGIEVFENSFLSNGFRFVSMPLAILLFIIFSFLAYRGFTLPDSSGSKIYTNSELLYQITIPGDWYVREGDPPVLFDRGFAEMTTVDNTSFYSSDQQCNFVIGNGNGVTSPPHDFRTVRAWQGNKQVQLYEETHPIDTLRQREFAYAPGSDVAVYAQCDLAMFRLILASLELHR